LLHLGQLAGGNLGKESERVGALDAQRRDAGLGAEGLLQRRDLGLAIVTQFAEIVELRRVTGIPIV